MTDINNFPFSNLSKQQKTILKILYKKKDKRILSSSLTWAIAEKFNKNHNNRIYNLKEERLKYRKEHPPISSIDRSTYIIADLIYKPKKDRILTNNHSASMSRSIKRLITRSLIEKWHPNGYLLQYQLTPKGLEYCEKFFSNG